MSVDFVTGEGLFADELENLVVTLSGVVPAGTESTFIDQTVAGPPTDGFVLNDVRLTVTGAPGAFSTINGVFPLIDGALLLVDAGSGGDVVLRADFDPFVSDPAYRGPEFAGPGVDVDGFLLPLDMLLDSVLPTPGPGLFIEDLHTATPTVVLSFDLNEGLYQALNLPTPDVLYFKTGPAPDLETESDAASVVRFSAASVRIEPAAVTQVTADPQSIGPILDTAGPITITLTGANPSAGPLSFAVTRSPSQGTLGAIVPVDDTTATVSYTPDLGASGLDVFQFETDNGIASLPASVAIQTFSVNDAPSFTSGGESFASNHVLSRVLANWATSISAGPADEAGQTVAFTVVGNSNPGLFAVPPAVSSDGTLTYSPAAGAVGTATIDLVLTDDGGTANGGADTSPVSTFEITITSSLQALVLNDSFDRPDASSLGGGWIEAEGPASQVVIQSLAARVDLSVGAANGVDFAHAVTVQDVGPDVGSTFTPRGLSVETFVTAAPLAGGFTSAYGIGLADPNNDDVDSIFIYLQGEADGFLDAYVIGLGGTLVGTQNDIAASDGLGFDGLRFEIDPSGTRLSVWFDDGAGYFPLFGGPLTVSPASLPSEVTVKIGNPYADGDTGSGPARAGALVYSFIRAWDEDRDEDGIVDPDDNCPAVSNPTQSDADGDGIGDLCEDLDADGVDDDLEDAGPNGGDGNGDGLLDSTQPEVATLPAAEGGGTITAVVSGACANQTLVARSEAELPETDLDFDYPRGLIDFALPCSSATLKLYFHGASALAGPYRNYGPTTPGSPATTTWYSEVGVSFGSEVVGGDLVATVTRSLLDGGVGDDTGVDGSIVGVGGPAEALGTPVPLLLGWPVHLLAGALIGVGALQLRGTGAAQPGRRKRRISLLRRVR